MNRKRGSAGNDSHHVRVEHVNEGEARDRAKGRSSTRFALATSELRKHLSSVRNPSGMIPRESASIAQRPLAFVSIPIQTPVLIPFYGFGQPSNPGSRCHRQASSELSVTCEFVVLISRAGTTPRWPAGRRREIDEEFSDGKLTLWTQVTSRPGE